MEPLIKEGDLVLAYQQPSVDSGSIAIVLHNEIAKIKKVIISEINTKRNYSLISLNSDFKDEIINNKADNLSILGLVKKIIQTPKIANLEG